MIKLTQCNDAYFGDYTDFYTCEANVASMRIVETRTRFGYRELTEIKTFDGTTIRVTEDPAQIIKMFQNKQ